MAELTRGPAGAVAAEARLSTPPGRARHEGPGPRCPRRGQAGLRGAHPFCHRPRPAGPFRPPRPHRPNSASTLRCPGCGSAPSISADAPRGSPAEGCRLNQFPRSRLHRRRGRHGPRPKRAACISIAASLCGPLLYVGSRRPCRAHHRRCRAAHRAQTWTKPPAPHSIPHQDVTPQLSAEISTRAPDTNSRRRIGRDYSPGKPTI